MNNEIQDIHKFFGNSIVLDKDINYEKYHGRELTIRIKNEKIDGIMIQRFFAIEDMMYVVLIVVPQNEIFSTKIQQFFNSFKVDSVKK